jgi:hypothetical protein
MREGKEIELAPVKVSWYEGGKGPAKPDGVSDKEWEKAADSAIFIGDRGVMFGPYTSHPKLAAATAAKGVTPPNARQPWFLPESPGHQQELIDASRGGPAPMSNFDYAAQLTETLLLGTIAQRLGRRIEWDAGAMKVTNVPEANRFVRAERRAGWEL